MKYLVLVGDGMADFPIDELGGKTPLESANTPAMDEIARRGVAGLFWPIPEGLSPGSDIGNLSLFGYDPKTSFTGRAPLEAARQGIRLSADQVAFRCNLVTLENGAMKSFTSGHITTEDARPLIEALNKGLGDLGVRFHTGVSYRHLAIMNAHARADVNDLVATTCTPPHDISDRPYEPHLPSGPAAEYLRDLIERSQQLLALEPVNAQRRANGELPATSAWLWGQGKAPALEPYQTKFGLTGAVISAVDLVKGIGICAGFEAIDVPGATGYLDTNYAGKVEAALDALGRVDFVYLHVEAPDETSHEGRLDLKLRAIEDFDREVVRPCLDHALESGDTRVVVAPDHVTALSTKTHAGGPVPFAMCGPGIAPNGADAYHESAAKNTHLVLHNGHLLIPFLLGGGSLEGIRASAQSIR